MCLLEGTLTCKGLCSVPSKPYNGPLVRGFHTLIDFSRYIVFMVLGNPELRGKKENLLKGLNAIV